VSWHACSHLRPVMTGEQWPRPDRVGLFGEAGASAFVVLGRGWDRGGLSAISPPGFERAAAACDPESRLPMRQSTIIVLDQARVSAPVAGLLATRPNMLVKEPCATVWNCGDWLSRRGRGTQHPKPDLAFHFGG
jgi:hypothetical protein